MRFNFGAFLGGMSEQISTNIEEAKAFNREKDFRMDMLAEEEATKMRLMKAERREKEKKRQKENASLLKAVGYTDAQASWIMQGGDASVSLYADWGSKAYAKGIKKQHLHHRQRCKRGQGISLQNKQASDRYSSQERKQIANNNWQVL